MQVYIPPKQPYCMNPLTSYTIVSEMTLLTAAGETQVPPLAMQTLAQSLRRSAVIDGFRASVEILGGKQVRLHFPRAVISENADGSSVATRLPQIGLQCDTLAETLTGAFSGQSGAAYTAMLRRINRHLNDNVVAIYFSAFVALNDTQNLHK